MKKQNATTTAPPQRIVIVGGGFAGVTLAQRLERLLPAVQQARQLAENLHSVSCGAATTPFDFRPRGMLASIGHRNAVAVIDGENCPVSSPGSSGVEFSSMAA